MSTKPMAVLMVHGYGWSSQHHKIIRCTLNFWEYSCQEPKMTERGVESLHVDVASTETDKNDCDCFIPYKHLPNLTAIKVGTTATIIGKVQLKHYQQQKLAIKLQETNTWYKGGNDLEVKEKDILIPQQMFVKRHKQNPSNRRPEIVCALL